MTRAILLAPLWAGPLLLAACGGGAGPEVNGDIEPAAETAAEPASAASPGSTTVVAPSPLPTARPPAFVSLAYLTAEVMVPELPTSFAAPVPDPALEALIRTTLSGREGSYSVVVHHLGNGRFASLNGDTVYYAASLFKVGLLLEAYRQRDAGELDFGQALTLEEKYVAYDLGTLEDLGLHEGDMVSVADAIKAMIVVSDTPTAVMIQDLVGPARVDATLRSLGIRDTSFNDYDLPSTASDMALLLEAIARGDGVTGESRQEMLSLLLQEGIRSGIPAALPADAAVAHKTGSWENATHDVGISWGSGGPYLIAVLSDQPLTWQPIVEVSRAVWDYFAANPSASSGQAP